MRYIVVTEPTMRIMTHATNNKPVRRSVPNTIVREEFGTRLLYIENVIPVKSAARINIVAEGTKIVESPHKYTEAMKEEVAMKKSKRSPPWLANNIRAPVLKYIAKKTNHAIVPSTPVVTNKVVMYPFPELKSVDQKIV